MAAPTVPANSDSGLYLTLVAEHGRCTCAAGDQCSEDVEERVAERKACRLCQHLDPEWPCPTLDEESAGYPDPDRVRVAPVDR